MRTSLALGSALVLLLCALPAAAQLELAGPPATEEAPRGFEASFAVHEGLRVGYATLATADGPLGEAIAGGPVLGVLLQHEAWRILDMRLHLLQLGAGWSEARGPELVSLFGLQLGTGLRARAGIVSFTATALVGLGAWLASGDPVTFDFGGELSIAFHDGCNAVEVGYQALATASIGGFAEAPSHGLVVRMVATSDGPDREACREEERRSRGT